MPSTFLTLKEHEYSSIRQFAPQFLETLSWQSHQDDDTVLEAIEVFRALNTANQRKLPDNVPLGFVADNWRRCGSARANPHDGLMSCARSSRSSMSNRHEPGWDYVQ